MAKYTILLTIVLALIWVSLSGYFQPLMISFAVVSILTVLGLCHRMKILDIETVPYEKTLSAIPYFGWLFKEIVKANVDVVKAVLSPEMEIKPAMIKVSNKRETDIGRTLFANSITLTPGTVSVEMSEDKILVHALLADISSKDAFAEMEERSGKAVGDTNADKGA